MGAETFVGSVTEDIGFYHLKLNQNPAVSANISFQVSYNKEIYNDRPAMDIYTTAEDENFKENCSVNLFGQLRNEDLHLPMKIGEYRGSNCLSFVDKRIKCTGDVFIQDYIPRYFSISFGFPCRLKENNKHSLRGLQFNITIYGLTNITTCVEMLGEKRLQEGPCGPLPNFTSIPNLFGYFDMHTLLSPQNQFIATAAEQELPRILSSLFPCHKYLREGICHLAFPQCEPSTGFTKHVCQEMCEEIRDTCWDTLLAIHDLLLSENNHNIDLLFHGHDFFVVEKVDANRNFLNCGYLPSHTSNIPCFYWQVTCEKPPTVLNAEMANVTGVVQQDKYAVHARVKYSCKAKDYKIEGNNTVVCLYSGKWSEPPKCSVSATSPVPIVVGVFSIPVVLLMAVLLICTLKPKPRMTRNRDFDAFVCFQFDADNDFVMNVLNPNLEPEFKLFIHSIDFKPGRNIHANIFHAIQSSNTAIIVLSNAFVNSQWCREEFEFCYRESKNDPAFKLLIILMEPKETLNLQMETCALIKFCVQNNTYLEKDDNKLWDKIGTHLIEVKLENRRNRNKASASLNLQETGKETEVFLEKL